MHTKGPWKILKRERSYSWFIVFKTRKDDEGKIKQRAEIANVYHKPYLVQEDPSLSILARTESTTLNYSANKTANDAEAKANAILIASAPELLCVLKHLVHNAETYCETDIETKQIIAEAKQVIAKAEGVES